MLLTSAPARLLGRSDQAVSRVGTPLSGVVPLSSTAPQRTVGRRYRHRRIPGPVGSLPDLPGDGHGPAIDIIGWLTGRLVWIPRVAGFLAAWPVA